MPYAQTSLLSLKSSLMRRSPERILIIKPSALGDVVQTLPLLPALRQRFPFARISWVIQHGLEAVLAGHPYLQDLIVFRRQGSWRDWMALLYELRWRSFDLTIDLQGLLRTSVMTAAARSPIRLGLETAREGSRWTLTHVVPDTGRTVPAWERYLRVLDAVDADRQLATMEIRVSSDDEHWAAMQLTDFSRPVLAVHPGARWVTKRWPVEKFAELLIRAHRTWNAAVVILGSAAERPDANQLQAYLAAADMKKCVRNLAGQTTLKQLTALLQQVDAVISNDSGPMHLAAGLGTPTLGIFTCTDAGRSGPGGQQHETVSTQVGCAGSYRKTCPRQGTAHLACFHELETVRVWSALERLIAKNSLLRKPFAAA